MGEHVLIIGGSSPLAMEAAGAFSERGDRVSVVSRSPTQADDLDIDARIKRFSFDLGDWNGIPEFFAGVVASGGAVARICFFQRYRNGAGSPWDGEYAVSLRATAKFMDVFSTQPPSQEDRSVVIVSSPADAGVVLEQGASYHAVKAGLSQLVRYYAVTLGCKRIRVNGIKPAIVLKPRAQKFYENNPELVRLFNRVTPLGRMGRPGDIANATLFLCSDRSSYITGQILSVDGGLGLHEAASLARLASSVFNSAIADPRWDTASE